MRQFVLPAAWDGSPELRLGSRDARHLVRVLRLGAGDRFPALDAEGRSHVCEIRAIETGSVLVAIEAAMATGAAGATEPAKGAGAAEGRGRAKAAVVAAHDASLPDLRGGKSRVPLATPRQGQNLPPIILAAALLKGDKFDLVVRQAAEAGVSRIIPLVTERSLGAPAGPARAERQRRILREALQQSGSSVATRFEEATGLEGLQARLGAPRGTRLALVLHETPLVEASLHGYLEPRPDEIVVCVGPEGGFAPAELDLLLSGGFLPLHLPGAVLRAETAAIFAVAAIEIVASEHDSWIRAQA